MRLLVARHGQTEWNAQNRVCGRTDQPLTQVGLAQADKLAELAGGRGIDLIICSPMLRARQTAAAVAGRYGIPMLTEPRLIEQDYGIYEGADRQDPGFLANKRQFANAYPGGESMLRLAHRVYSLLEDVKREHDGKTVLLVCHGGVCRMIRTWFENMTNEEFASYSPDNASIAEYFL